MAGGSTLQHDRITTGASQGFFFFLFFSGFVVMFNAGVPDMGIANEFILVVLTLNITHPAHAPLKNRAVKKTNRCRSVLGALDTVRRGPQCQPSSFVVIPVREWQGVVPG